MTHDQLPDEQEQTATTDQPPPKRNGFPSGVVLLIVSALLGTVAAVGMLLSNDGDSVRLSAESAAVRPIRDWQADDFTLTSLDGETVSLSDYAGRPVFLNFWATWCEPCKREFPAFQQFMAEQPDDGPVILSVNQGESAEAVDTFLDELGVSGITILLDSDLDLPNDYPARNLPATYVIDTDGFVRFAKYGEVTSEQLYDYLDELEPASRG